MRFTSLLLGIALCASSALAQSGSNLPSFPGRILSTATTPSAGATEVQTLTLGGTPTGGSFRLSFLGSTTGAIAWSATNATLVANIDAALEALPTIGTGGVVTAAGSLTAGIGTITLTFSGGNLQSLALPNVTVASNSLTGTSPTLAVAETTPGVTADGRGTPKGTLCTALDTGVLYANTGTALSPVWTKVSAQ